MKNLHEQPQRFWLSEIAKAAATQGIPLPSFACSEVDHARTTNSDNNRAVTFQRRNDSVEVAEKEGIEWGLWTSKDDMPVPVATFHESIYPNDEAVSRVLAILKGWLVDDWTPDEATAAVEMMQEDQQLSKPTEPDDLLESQRHDDVRKSWQTVVLGMRTLQLGVMMVLVFEVLHLFPEVHDYLNGLTRIGNRIQQGPIMLLYCGGIGMMFAGALLCACIPEPVQTTGIVLLAAFLTLVFCTLPFSFLLLAVYVRRINLFLGNEDLADQSRWFFRTSIFYLIISFVVPLALLVLYFRFTYHDSFSYFRIAALTLAATLLLWFIRLLWRTQTTIQHHVRKHLSEPFRHPSP
ncbi:MAG: hypothetical protein ACFCD0_01140 [Gemmataceae bacterium]